MIVKYILDKEMGERIFWQGSLFFMALCQVLGWDSYESRPVTIFKAFFTFLGSIFILGHDK